MFDLDATTESIARRILKAQEDYLKEQEQYAQEGYRMPECFHGTNQWVDYDAICGGCEDGAVNEYSTVAEVLADARDLALAEQARIDRQREEDHGFALYVNECVDLGKVTRRRASTF